MAEKSSESRRASRAGVILIGEIEHDGGSLPVTISNLSARGALVVGESLPVEGSSVVFRRNEIAVACRIAWLEGSYAGLEFAEPLQIEDLLCHVRQPRTVTRLQFRRSRLKSS